MRSDPVLGTSDETLDYIALRYARCKSGRRKGKEANNGHLARKVIAQLKNARECLAPLPVELPYSKPYEMAQHCACCESSCLESTSPRQNYMLESGFGNAMSAKIVAEHVQQMRI